MSISEPQAGHKKVGLLAKSLYFLATVQLATYYIRDVPSYLRLTQYEDGAAHMPFQGRLMMMFLLGWAHASIIWITLADGLNRFVPWLLPHCTPEAALQLCIDVACIAVTGAVATRLYQTGSKEQLLVQWIYPLVLVLCVTTYILHITQNLRFYYDLPSMMFFSVGLYLIYFRWHSALFAALFLIGTVNRETTLFLLLFFVLARLAPDRRIDLRRLQDRQMWTVVIPLAAAWLAWHVWVGWVFRQNPSECTSKFLFNLILVLMPWTWPQLAGAGCYLFPVVLLLRRSIQDSTIRMWVWALPAWYAVMFFYGILVETRIFGELIGYIACVTALIAEQGILSALESHGWSNDEGLQAAGD